MKTYIFTLFLLCSTLYAQNVQVEDYKVPVSRANNFRINGFWNWSQVENNVTANSASANVAFKKFYSSLPYAWFFTADASGSKNFSTYSYDVDADLNLRKYIWNDRDWFGMTRIVTEAAKSFEQVASSVTIGAGYGRYINATALAKAVRIEEHLLKENILTDHLPKDIIINIAQIIERQTEYQNKYGEAYETQWFDDIEKELIISGLLKGYSLGSIGILRIRQVLFSINEKVNDRYYGWDLSLGTLFSITTHDKSDPGSPNLTISGRYSYPIGWSMQVNTSGEIVSPLDTLFIKKVSAASNIDFIYELSNRINLVAGYKLGLTKYPDNTTYANNLLSISFLYYIENNIYLGLNMSYEKYGSSPRKMSTNLTLSYNLF
jgi:hypothetical protein